MYIYVCTYLLCNCILPESCDPFIIINIPSHTYTQSIALPRVAASVTMFLVVRVRSLLVVLSSPLGPVPLFHRMTPSILTKNQKLTLYFLAMYFTRSKMTLRIFLIPVSNTTTHLHPLPPSLWKRPR